MKLIRVTKRPAGGTSARRCRHALCGKEIMVGDLVLHQRLPNNPFGDRDLFFHAACVRGVLDGPEPPPRPTKKQREHQVDFDALRQRMLERGTPYV